MRKTLSDLLVESAKGDADFLVLSGDHGYALFDALRAYSSEQFINAGIAEQNMIGVAAGLAKAGMRPVVYGLAAFVPIRVLEQIKMDICFEGLPVIFLGDGAGFVYSTLGASHQCFEDVSALRAVGGIEIFCPSDRHELARCFAEAKNVNRPVYIRLCKADLGDVHAGPLHGDMPIDIVSIIERGSDVLCLATGSMVRLAKNVIEKHQLPIDLHSVVQLKGVNAEKIRQLCGERTRVITCEEHSVFGGLGSMVAEAVAGMGGFEFNMVGIRDRYSLECGTYAHLLRYHGLDEATLYNLFSRSEP